MKIKSNRVLYLNYHSSDVDDTSPRQECGDSKYGIDYSFVRAGTLFDVYDYLPYIDNDIKETSYENEVVAVAKNGFHIIFETLYDLQHSGWFKEIISEDKL